jgi:hypothetical protein
LLFAASAAISFRNAPAFPPTRAAITRVTPAQQSWSCLSPDHDIMRVTATTTLLTSLLKINVPLSTKRPFTPLLDLQQPLSPYSLFPGNFQ